MTCVIGIDIGTYEAKGIAVDVSGRVLATATRAHALSVPRPGFAEHDAETVWWDGLVTLVQELLASDAVDARSVAAICCSGIGPCVLPVTRDGQPLRPAILYGVDTRAGAEIDQLNQRLGVDQIIARSGSELSSQSAGPKIAWLQANEPEIFARADLFVTCQSFLVGRLTGEWVIDHGTAGYFHPFYDLATTRWCTDGVEDIIDERRLPRLAWANEIVGSVTAEAARQTGLPVGTPVLAGAADAPVEALSAGVLSVGDLMIMYGSSHFMLEVVDRPVTGTTLYTAPYLFADRYVLAAGTSTAGTLTRWFARLVGRDPTDDPGSFAELASEAASSPPGANGLLALPHFSGERTPYHDPSLVGGVFGLTLSHSRADVYRAFLEGIAHSVDDILRAYEQAGQRPERVIAVGGGTKNDVWTQAVSDVTGREQLVVGGAGASFGDAMLAGLAVGFIEGHAGIAGWIAAGRTSRPRAEFAETYAVQRELIAAYRVATTAIARRLPRTP